MSGSVYEWCSDYYSNSYYEVSPRYNPQGPDGNPSNTHVCRGYRYGDYSSKGEFNCYVSCLYGRNPASSAEKYRGFRLVLSADTIKWAILEYKHKSKIQSFHPLSIRVNINTMSL